MVTRTIIEPGVAEAGFRPPIGSGRDGACRFGHRRRAGRFHGPAPRRSGRRGG